MEISRHNSQKLSWKKKLFLGRSTAEAILAQYLWKIHTMGSESYFNLEPGYQGGRNSNWPTNSTKRRRENSWSQLTVDQQVYSFIMIYQTTYIFSNSGKIVPTWLRSVIMHLPLRSVWPRTLFIQLV